MSSLVETQDVRVDRGRGTWMSYIGCQAAASQPVKVLEEGLPTASVELGTGNDWLGYRRTCELLQGCLGHRWYPGLWSTDVS